MDMRQNHSTSKTIRSVRGCLLFAFALSFFTLCGPDEGGCCEWCFNRRVYTKDDLPELIADLDASTSEKRFNAISELGQLGADAAPAVPRLIDILKNESEDKTIRARVADELGSIGSAAKPAIPVFLDIMQNTSNVGLRGDVSLGLIKMGKYATDVVPDLIQLLEREIKKIQKQAGGDANKASELQLIVGNDMILRGIVFTLAQNPSRADVIMPCFINLIYTTQGPIRGLIATAIVRLGVKPKQAISAFIRALKDPDSNVRRDVSEALGTFGPIALPALDALVDSMLHDPHPNVRQNAVYAISELGVPATKVWPALIEASQDHEHHVRSSVLLAMVKMDAERALPLLETAMNDLDKFWWTNISMSLNHNGPRTATAVPVLLKLLREGEVGRKNDAAEALGKIGPPAQKAVPALIDALNNQYEAVRNPAALALGKIHSDPQIVVPALIQAMKLGPTSAPLSATQALGEYGPAAKTAVPVLTEAAEHSEDPEVRKAASESLKKINVQ